MHGSPCASRLQTGDAARRQRRGPTVAVRANDDNALVAKLAEANVVASCRDGNVRAMFHCYNNRTDVDALVNALLANRDFLRT